MNFLSTKTYGHDIGLSAVFRQPNADHSHCHFLHGYSLAFKFTFACNILDDKNWVVDFGGLKELKQWLQDNFDHKVVITKDDPKIDILKNLEKEDLAQLTILDRVGAEAFAYEAWNYANNLVKTKTGGRCWCVSAECKEHGANSAIYQVGNNE